MINQIKQTQERLLEFSKSKGFLSPLWLLPNTDPDGVQRAFQELETFLTESYYENELEASIELNDVKDFIWKLKKKFAFKGWEGIAPYLLRVPVKSDNEYFKSCSD